MQTADIMFGEWLPSRPDYKNPGCIVANNIIPTPGGYGPLHAPLANTGTAAGACRGAAQFFGLDGARVVVGGTADSLFVLRGGTLTETTGLTDIGTGSWTFARFNDMIVATGPGNAPLYLDDLDTDTGWSALPGSPPTALYCARVSDFLMLGAVNANTARVQWSPLNDPAGTWGADRRTQAGFLECPRALGAVVGITGGRFPLIFQERGVSRIEYVGPPRVWARQEVEQARGCLAPQSIVQIGFLCYYLGGDGFYVTDGSQFQPISSGRVTRWFFNEANPSDLVETHGAIDWVNECVVWAFKSRTGGGIFDRLLIYSWAENRWSTATVTVGRLLDIKAAGMTLEEIAVLYPSIEDVPVSFDDTRWQGSERALAAFIDGASSTVLHYFNGAALEADWETGEMQPLPGRRAFVSGARPLIDGTGATVAAWARQNDRTGAYTAFTGAGADGRCPLRADGMTMRLACKMPAGADWSDAQGLQVAFRPSGGR